MKDNEKMLDDILRRIVQEISITTVMAEKAVESYEAVGKWIGEGLPYDVHINPQGSMSLGTTNKPITDKDDYDIDLVCLLKDGKNLAAEQIKNVVGDRLKEHELYRKKITEEGEGKRCWKMQYYEFHMDILPCVPLRFYLEPDFTDIRLTHKSGPHNYEDRYSNPIGYRRWFEGRMRDVLDMEKRAFAAKNQVEIENVPNYSVKTPLQMVIQLLKRHRDICFEYDTDNAPISIIITTLAAHAYSGEMSLYDAMCNILDHMTDKISIRDGVYWIENPVMPAENFADKWVQYPARQEAFFAWVTRARKELIDDPLRSLGIDQLKKHYASVLGEAPVARAIKSLGEETRFKSNNNALYSAGLTSGLTGATVAGVKQVKGHTFFGQ